jgi:hypothetical protein
MGDGICMRAHQVAILSCACFALRLLKIKPMKKTILFLALLASCTSQKIDLLNYKTETKNGRACGHPQYVATIAKQNTALPAETSLTFYNLLKDAQTAHGTDVTIQNVRYDLEKGVKISVIYDVVKCDTMPGITREKR